MLPSPPIPLTYHMWNPHPISHLALTMCTDNEKKRDQKFWCVRQEKREALRFFCQKRKCFQWRRVKNELYWCRWLIFLLIFYLNVIFEKKQPICLLQPMLLFLNSIPPQKTLMNTPSRQFQVIWNFWLRIQNFNVAVHD